MKLILRRGVLQAWGAKAMFTELGMMGSDAQFFKQ
jgi:hypothetical protein